MSTATPTLIPRAPLFPSLIPPQPLPHPVTLPREVSVNASMTEDEMADLFQHAPRARFNAVRNMAKEMDDLTEEELMLDAMVRADNFLLIFPG